MAHIIQPIMIDATAYCCKCYGVSDFLGRGTKGVLTDGALEGEPNTAVITNDCSPWTLLQSEEAIDTYEMWWAEGFMDCTMVYTHSGTEYLANHYNAWPKVSALFDPYNNAGDGIVAERAFRAVGPVQHPDVDVFSGSTLQVSVPTGDPVPAKDALVLRNFQGASGGDMDNHYWKLISSVAAGQGEITFGVSCGTTVEIDLEVTSFPQTDWVLDVDIYIDGILDSTETFSYLSGIFAASVSLIVTGGPCGNLITLHAFFTANPAIVTLEAEVTSIT